MYVVERLILFDSYLVSLFAGVFESEEQMLMAFDDELKQSDVRLVVLREKPTMMSRRALAGSLWDAEHWPSGCQAQLDISDLYQHEIRIEDGKTLRKKNFEYVAYPHDGGKFTSSLMELCG